jgi:uncharacterized protein (TIGR00369 family)
MADEPTTAADPQGGRIRTVTWNDPAVYRTQAGLSGYELLDSIAQGRLPWPPIHRLLGFQGESFGDGRVAMSFEPAEYHYNPLGGVHGGVLTTILDTVMACAVHTKLAAGEEYTTLDLHVNFVRGVTVKTGRVRAIGEVIHLGRRVATAKGELIDLEGRLYAHATTTCMILRPEGGKESR